MDITKEVVIKEVYNKFISTETEREWTTFDDLLEMLDYLDDDQLHREADVAYSHGNTGCSNKTPHDDSKCFIPTIVKSVNFILESYKDSGKMYIDHKYILQYYLVLVQTGQIN